ncbi:MAG: 1-phosphofructokinase [Breznakia sp.]
MIYTLTLNASLDYIVEVNPLVLGETNRASSEQIVVGGKGINVSIVLQHLHHPTCALGYLAGFTGKEIKRSVKEMDLIEDFIEVEHGLTRINVKIKSQEESEINASGPMITEEDEKKLFQKLNRLQEHDVLVLAGSLPQGVEDDIYARIMEHIQHKKVLIVVDATKKALLKTLAFHPFLIKPNKDELAQLFQTNIETNEDTLKYAHKLQALGARNVLVSLGKEGAILLDENKKTYEATAPKGKLVNSVGAGDSMVAGFLHGYMIRHNYKDAFVYGVCAGSASAFLTPLASYNDIEALKDTVLSTVKEG